MIEHTFSVKNDERMIITKNVIRQQMPTARFKHNPYRNDNGTWNVTLTYESADSEKINILLNKFHDEDNPPIPKKKSLFEKILSWF